MNKYFVIGMLTSAIVFAIYDITKTIEAKKRNRTQQKVKTIKV